MSDIIGCRLCLASDVRMYVITSSQLLDVYESLTGISICMDENGIKTACYLCIAKLKKCLAFKMQSLRAYEVLTQFLSGDLKITQQAFSNIDRKSYNLIPGLTISTIKDHDFVFIAEEKDKEIETQWSIKEEPVKSNVMDFNCVETEFIKTEFIGVGENECDIDIKIKIEPEEVPQEEVIYQTYNHTNYQSSQTEEKFVDMNLTPFPNRKLKGKKTGKRSCEVRLSGKANNKRTSVSNKNGINYKNENIHTSDIPLRNDLSKERSIEEKNSKSKSDLQSFMKSEFSVSEETFRKNNTVDQTSNYENEKYNINKYNCEKCSYQTISKISLVRHKSFHDESRPFICDHCGFRFAVKPTLCKHIIARHLGGQFRCDLRDQNRKLSHKRKMRLGKPFVCSTCGYKCARKFRYENHLRVHTGEKPYSCTFCDYKCSEETTLKRHIRTHTGEKPFECTLCSYKSADKRGLEMHMRRHTGEKPFSCSHCDYKSCSRHYIKLHERKHTGEKPCVCKFCSFRCSNTSYLSIHMRKHTGFKPYSCAFCEYKCSDGSSFTKHSKVHRKKIP